MVIKSCQLIHFLQALSYLILTASCTRAFREDGTSADPPKRHHIQLRDRSVGAWYVRSHPKSLDPKPGTAFLWFVFTPKGGETHRAAIVYHMGFKAGIYNHWQRGSEGRCLDLHNFPLAVGKNAAMHVLGGNQTCHNLTQKCHNLTRNCNLRDVGLQTASD